MVLEWTVSLSYNWKRAEFLKQFNTDAYGLPSHMSPVNPTAHIHLSTSPFFVAWTQVASFKQGECFVQSISTKTKTTTYQTICIQPKIEKWHNL